MDRKDKNLTLSAIGLDAPGLVWKISERIFDLGGNIVDVEEHSRRGLFAIYLEIDFTHSPHTLDDILQNLSALERDTGLKIILKETPSQRPVSETSTGRYIITVLGIDRPGIMTQVSGLLASQNINIEHCRMIARGDFFSMQMVVDTSRISIPGETNDPIVQLKADLKQICQQLGQSVVIQDEAAHKKMKKLIVFDVESALIQENSIARMLQALNHLLHAKGERPVQLPERTPRVETLINNTAKLKGLPYAEMQRLAEQLALNPGTVELLGILKSMGFKIALLSSGLEVVLKKLFEGVDVDYAFANTLKVGADGKLTGELEEPLITDESKAHILEFIMNMEHAHPDQVIAIGDGSPRSGFIQDAGLSIAYQPKEGPVTTDGVLKTDQISHVLYCLGIPMVELKKYTEKGPLNAGK